MSIENGMIIMKGIDPKLDLGIEFTNEEKFSIPICSAIDEKVIVLGRMDLTPYNFSKIKSYNWKYIERSKEGNGWVPAELDFTGIPRTTPDKEELIKVSISEEGIDEEGILF